MMAAVYKPTVMLMAFRIPMQHTPFDGNWFNFVPAYHKRHDNIKYIYNDSCILHQWPDQCLWGLTMTVNDDAEPLWPEDMAVMALDWMVSYPVACNQVRFYGFSNTAISYVEYASEPNQLHYQDSDYMCYSEYATSDTPVPNTPAQLFRRFTDAAFTDRETYRCNLHFDFNNVCALNALPRRDHTEIYLGAQRSNG